MAGGYREEAGGARARLLIVEREIAELRERVAVLEAARQPVVTADELESEHGDRNMYLAAGGAYGMMGGILLGGGLYVAHSVSGFVAIVIFVACVVGSAFTVLKTGFRGVKPYEAPVHTAGPPTEEERDARARIATLEDEAETVRGLLLPRDDEE